MWDGSTSGLPPVGAVIGEKYRIERVLGSGGMGVVLAATHLPLRRAVAIKIVLPGAVDRERLSARLLHEARASAQLRGEHVARVIDVDTLDDGTPYMVMEYVAGRTLRSVLDRETRLSHEDVIEHAIEACDALTAAHGAGIVHRDIKPANLYLVDGRTERRTLRLLDFGVCRTLHPKTDPGASPSSRGFIGTPHYVSPEQVACPDEADARSDLWSLGIVLYECLAGRVPFRAPTLALLWHRIMLEPTPPFEAGLSVPVALEQVVLRCLAKEPEARFPSAQALSGELCRARFDLPRLAPSGPRAHDRPGRVDARVLHAVDNRARPRGVARARSARL
jgi:serine/threonine-protein kinase